MPEVKIYNAAQPYYKVKLEETVGEGPGAVNFSVWVRHIPAAGREDAAEKAILYQLTHVKGSRPKLAQVELEDYSRPIQI